MNKIYGFLLCAGLSFSLIGCAEKWQKPGGTERDFEAMKASCASRAAAKFPPLMRLEQATNGYVTPETTTCKDSGRSVTCRTTGGQYVPPTVMAVDDNEEGRNQEIRACFFERGWQPVED